MENEFIILYRYHKDFQLVLKRLKLIKHIDPNIPIYGLYGGEASNYDEATKILEPYIEDNYLIKVEDGIWKWLHADITYQMWYNDVGKTIDFSYIAVLEWDLLYMETIKNLFPKLNNNELRVSGIIPLNKIAKNWYWSTSDRIRKYETFKEKVEVFYNIKLEDYAMLGPGLCMPRNFLEDLNNAKLFEAEISDELKIPVWAQVFGYKLVSNNFYRTWFSSLELNFFNSNIIDVNPDTVKKEMNKAKGRRAFHPFRDNDSSLELKTIYDSSIKKVGHTVNNSNYPVRVIKPYLYKLHCKISDYKLQKAKSNKK